MKRARLILWVVLGAAILIIVLQNFRQVEARLLLVTVTMPLALLVFVVALGGYVMGLLTAAAMPSRRAPGKNP